MSAFGKYLLNKHAYNLKDPIITKKDYLSACRYAHLKSKKTFDKSRGVKFTTYEYYKIRREIDYINKHITKHKNILPLENENMYIDDINNNIMIRYSFHKILKKFSLDSQSIIIDKYVNYMTFKEIDTKYKKVNNRRILSHFKKLMVEELSN